MKAVIMAGGKGERLRPFTYVSPKPLLPVNETNSIEYSIRNLKDNGFDDFIISINYLKEKFSICKEYEEKYKINISFIEEENRMGTAGSLKLMKDQLDEAFLLLNGDLFTKIDYRRMYENFTNSDCDCLIGIKKQENKSPYGVVDFDVNFDVKDIQEKPTSYEWINAGVYMFKSESIDFIKNTYTDVTDLITLLRNKNKRVKVFDIGDKWIDIGKIEDYKNAEIMLKNWN